MEDKFAVTVKLEGRVVGHLPSILLPKYHVFQTEA